MVHCHGAKSMIGNRCITSRSCSLLTLLSCGKMIHDALRHCNRRKQWAKPSHLNELDWPFSVLAVLDFIIRIIGFQFQSEIRNSCSKRRVDSSRTYNFWYLYAFIRNHIYFNITLTLPIFKVWNTHVVDFESSWINIYAKHKVSMIRINTPTILSRRLCVYVCCLCHFLFSTKTVNFDEWFESLELNFNTVDSIILKIKWVLWFA